MLYAIVFGVIWSGLATFVIRKNFTKVQAWLGGFLVTILLMFPAMMVISTFESMFRSVDSVESAKSFVVGTWVYDENTAGEDKYPEWERLNISNNGMVTIERALPSENAWRDKEVKNYRIVSEKYSDNGRRYFAMAIDEYTAVVYIIEGSNLVKRNKGTNYNAKFRRGDRDLAN